MKAKIILGPGFPSTHVSVRDSLWFVLHSPELCSQAFQLLPPSLTTSSQTDDSWRTPHRHSLWPSHVVRLLPQALAKLLSSKATGLVFPDAQRPGSPSGLLLGGVGTLGAPLRGLGSRNQAPPPPGVALPFPDPGLVNRQGHLSQVWIRPGSAHEDPRC